MLEHDVYKDVRPFVNVRREYLSKRVLDAEVREELQLRLNQYMTEAEGPSFKDYSLSLSEWWDNTESTAREVEGSIADLRRLTAGLAQMLDLWKEDGERAWDTVEEEDGMILLGRG